jgi:hypothetical protein
MVVGGAKDGSEKASPTSPLAKSSESSTGTITPSLPSGLAIEQNADATRERLTSEVYLRDLLAPVSTR